jgi:hypothetical protein
VLQSPVVMRLQSGIPVVSIAEVSFAVVSIAVPLVIIAVVSIAEPHHVMRLQCWVGLKRKFLLSYLHENFAKSLSLLTVDNGGAWGFSAVAAAAGSYIIFDRLYIVQCTLFKELLETEKLRI